MFLDLFLFSIAGFGKIKCFRLFSKMIVFLPIWLNQETYLKSDNLQYNVLGRCVDRLINQASDGPSIILIDWK